MTMKLYEIDKALLDVIESGYSVDEETGEILFEPSDLEQLEAERNEKLEACAIYLKQLQADVAALEDEKKRLEARLKAKQRKADYMGQYVLTSLLWYAQSAFETPRVALSTRSSTRVDVYDADKLPESFVRVKITKAADKTAIGKVLRKGDSVPGAELVTVTNLVVK